MKQLNFNNYREQLTSDDIDQLVELLGHRCRIDTVNLLRQRLEKHTALIPYWGILNRLIKEGNDWSYCAGQSYPDEIRTVRKIILELK